MISLLKVWNIWSLSWSSCETLCMALVCWRLSLVQLSLLNKIFIATTVKSSSWWFHMRVTSLLGNFSWVSLYTGMRVLWVLWMQVFKWEFSPVNKILIGKFWGSPGMVCLPCERRWWFLGFQRVKRELQVIVRAAQVLDLAWLGQVSVCWTGWTAKTTDLAVQDFPSESGPWQSTGSILPFLRMQFEEHFLCTPVLI